MVGKICRQVQIIQLAARSARSRLKRGLGFVKIYSETGGVMRSRNGATCTKIAQKQNLSLCTTPQAEKPFARIKQTQIPSLRPSDSRPFSGLAEERRNLFRRHHRPRRSV